MTSNTDKSFNIGSEENLKQLMYRIEQRYYTTPIGNEKRLANSITTIEKPDTMIQYINKFIFNRNINNLKANIT